MTNTPIPTSLTHRLAFLIAALLTLIAVLALAADRASAVEGTPVLNVTQQVYPTHLAHGGTGNVRIRVSNLGPVDTTAPITAHVRLPEGATVNHGLGSPSSNFWDCPEAIGTNQFTCTYSGSLAHYDESDVSGTIAFLDISIAVGADASEHGQSTVDLTGGGDPTSDVDVQATTVSADPAGFGIAGFKGWATNPDGSAAHQAGGHPDLTTQIEVNTATGPVGPGIDPSAPAGGNVKNLTVALPDGLIGNPTAVPTCDPELLVTEDETSHCPAASQVGVLYVGLGAIGRIPVYNMVAPPGKPARFAGNFSGVAISIDPEIRTGGDYGVTATVASISQTLALRSSKLTLWGVPADPIHDAQRIVALVPVPSTAPVRPFITAPTQCSGQPLETKLTATSWNEPTTEEAASFSTDMDGDPITVTGCDKLAFTPTVAAAPTSTQPDAPSGLNVEINSPQNLDAPDGLASAHLKDVKVTLPEGMTINPGSADGLGACSDEQLGLSNANEPSCPDSSRIGSVTAKSPLLEEELSGGVYIRSQASNDPESGEMFRMALILENKERGVLVKLPGAIRVNKDTGRIVTEFDNNPQLPVEHIALSLKSGPRSPLATPTTCGSKSIDTQLTSWAGQTVNTSSSFDVACIGGLGGFAPSLKAGTTNPVGGAFSPFGLTINKPDGNKELTGLSMSLPAGLLAQLKGNLNTQVGTVTAFAGPGSNPFALPGQVYLEGAYGDAPFSLKVVVPAKAGPFDLGTVEVKQKIYVDPIDSHVTVVSDPLPTIVKGVPVRLQRLDVNIDKAGFIINPTSCAPKAFTGTLGAIDGQTAPINVRFQVGSCSDLALKPSLGLTLSGKGQTTDGKHPAVTAALTQKSGQANLKKVRVALPLSLALDPDNANGLCEFVDGSKVTPTCPKSSIVGTATATTPILDEPLSGPVYFVKNVRKDAKTGRDIKTLPKLVIPLVGQNGVKLTLTGTSDVENDQLVTTFDNIPDAPVSSFKLSIIGGKGGILAVSGADICKATQVADQQINGQNSKAANADVYIETPSCPLKVLSKKVGKSSVAIKVGGLGAGKVTVTGRGIKKTTKTISKSTVATITAKRTKGKPGKVTVSFDPAGPAKARKTSK
jgi:hypothetical protein